MSSNVVLLIQNNEVVGHSTDTVFGLISKLDKNNIKRINTLKGREEDQPLQILVSSIDEIKNIIEHNEFVDEYLKNNIEDKTSYIVRVNEDFNRKYLLDSFNQTIMFRIPQGSIRELIESEKLLFATSANKHGKEPVENKEEFKNEFPDLEAFGNDKKTKASKIISLVNNKVEIKRN